MLGIAIFPSDSPSLATRYTQEVPRDIHRNCGRSNARSYDIETTSLDHSTYDKNGHTMVKMQGWGKKDGRNVKMEDSCNFQSVQPAAIFHCCHVIPCSAEILSYETLGMSNRSPCTETEDTGVSVWI